MKEKIKDWYLSIEDDTVVIHSEVTFADVLLALIQGVGAGIYDVIFESGGDSIEREHIFSEIANRMGWSYNLVYEMWLGVGGDQSRVSTPSKYNKSTLNGIKIKHVVIYSSSLVRIVAEDESELSVYIDDVYDNYSTADYILCQIQDYDGIEVRKY